MKALLLCAVLGMGLPLFSGCHADADVGDDHVHTRTVREERVVVPEHTHTVEKDVTVRETR